MLTGTVAASKLTIDKGGTVDGNVEADTVVIDGTFSGTLVAGSVCLGRTASVNANITYVSMEMHAGAVHCGQSRRVDSIKTKTANSQRAGPVLELIHRAPETA